MVTFEQTWRWFGPNDPFSLKEIKQTGATGIVTALHQIPVGEVWPVEEIMTRKQMIEAEGLTWSVTESIPVHEDIKRREGNYRQLIENYKQTVRNLAQCGINIVCYNFMPILDWLRTDLNVVFRDGSITSKFETKALAAFDIFILKRADAEKDYTEAQLNKAKEFFDELNDEQKKRLTDTVLFGLPGSWQAYTLDEFRSMLSTYHDIGDDDLRDNLYSFIRELIPTAEEAGVLMAIHPDDPPWPLLGLPRVVSTKRDIERILSVTDSISNGITLCTGSFGASVNNDLVDMTRTFAKRVSFVHLRNVRRNSDGDFLEENHLDGDIDLYSVMKILIEEQNRRVREGRKDIRIPFRPDHGHLMLPDMNRKGIYPGYSLFGRMRGLAELRGLEMGIRRSLEID
jgi:mannonate dehydratase